MALDPETVLDRRRLKRRVTFWRIAAVALGVAFLAVLVLSDRQMGTSGGFLPHIARVTVSGIITADMAVGPLSELGAPPMLTRESGWTVNTCDLFSAG